MHTLLRPAFRLGKFQRASSLWNPSARFSTTSVSKPIFDKIKKDIAESKCVVYMKGTPSAPQCGFSNAVINVLEAEGASYTAHNVLEDPELRQGIKEFSDWPTIPQVYLNGEFVGGCDILLQHYKSGELTQLLEKAGALKERSKA
ncbi:Glutaredoxin- protein 5, mitochondrial [Balamuthia mandrillaris]